MEKSNLRYEKLINMTAVSRYQCFKDGVLESPKSLKFIRTSILLFMYNSWESVGYSYLEDVKVHLIPF